jgi:SWI/SNF-related matrix-associated actin-dependent regulator 1 of chromatin subfamily A
MEIVEFLNEFHITTSFGRFKERERDMIKSLQTIDGGKAYRWNNDKKVWVVPIKFKEQVYAIGKACRSSHIQIKDNLPERVDTIPALPKLDITIPLKKGAMRNYQEEGVARGLQLKRFINGDQPGLGKTLQSIATVYGAELKGDVTFPCLVICPSALKINWSREFEMWTDKKAIVLHDGIKTTWHRWWEMDMADVFIVNYESMKKYFVTDMPDKKNLEHSSQIIMDERIKMFKSVIVDESHRLKDPKSIQAKICINITKSKEYIILLTGTPVVNKPIDLFSQLAVMFKLAHFGGANGFKQRYCEGGRGASNLAELNYLLNMTCFFQRKKEEVLKDLPALTRQTIICSITNRAEFNKESKCGSDRKDYHVITTYSYW